MSFGAVKIQSKMGKGSDPSIEDPLYMIRMPADRSFYTIYTDRKYVPIFFATLHLSALARGLAAASQFASLTQPDRLATGASRSSWSRGLLRPLRGSACGLGQPDAFGAGASPYGSRPPTRGGYDS